MTLRSGNFYIKTASQRHRTEQNGDLRTTNTHIRRHCCVCVYIQTHLHSTIQMGIATQHSATTVLYSVSDARTCLQPHSLHAFHHYPTSLAFPSQQVTPPLYLLTPSILPSPYLDPDSEIPHYLEHCIYWGYYKPEKDSSSESIEAVAPRWRFRRGDCQLVSRVWWARSSIAELLLYFCMWFLQKLYTLEYMRWHFLFCFRSPTKFP